MLILQRSAIQLLGRYRRHLNALPLRERRDSGRKARAACFQAPLARAKVWKSHSPIRGQASSAPCRRPAVLSVQGVQDRLLNHSRGVEPVNCLNARAK
jgi:hypothetical protein